VLSQNIGPLLLLTHFADFARHGALLGLSTLGQIVRTFRLCIPSKGLAIKGISNWPTLIALLQSSLLLLVYLVVPLLVCPLLLKAIPSDRLMGFNAQRQEVRGRWWWASVEVHRECLLQQGLVGSW
jgi:hypothetical protein